MECSGRGCYLPSSAVNAAVAGEAVCPCGAREACSWGDEMGLCMYVCGESKQRLSIYRQPLLNAISVSTDVFCVAFLHRALLKNYRFS